jgi:hypothetical protein
MSFCNSLQSFFNLMKTQITECFWDKRLDYDTEIKKVQERFNNISENNVSRYSRDIGTLFRKNNKNKTHFSLDNLNGIININLKDKTINVGAKTRYYDILNETLKYGLMPKIVPELSSITVGGAITGISIESSSFKYGWGHDSVVDMDILIASGDVLFCTRDNVYKDLFNAIPNSYGTVGYITRVRIELVEAKNFVNVTNHKFNNYNEAFHFMKKITELNSDKIDFMDAVAFNKNEVYVVTGILSNVANHLPNNYPEDGLYYESIGDFETDTFTLYDYYWRWDADMFWGVTNVHFLKNKWMRKICGRKLLNTRTLRAVQKIMKSTNKKRKHEHIVQDLGVPYENSCQFYNWICDELNIYPLWICPVKPKKSNTSLWSYNKNQLYFDIGVFGNKKLYVEDGEIKHNYYNKKIEDKLLDIDGNKCFYSGTFFTKEQFDLFIDKEKYNKIKNTYDINNRFGDLYSKVISD